MELDLQVVVSHDGDAGNCGSSVRAASALNYETISSLNVDAFE